MDTHNRKLVSLPVWLGLRLLLLVLCCMVLANIIHAQSFTVLGTSGHNWVDTQLDIAPGTLLEFSATGSVDVGSGWGSFGPEGTRRFANVSGYPAETPFRYGLVARLTRIRTPQAPNTPEDDLHEDWSYGEARQYCAMQGGHLWLTVNDDNPGDNSGDFRVQLTRSDCPGQPQRGNFRITLTGFFVNNATVDTMFEGDGKGDEVYTATEVAELTAAGQILGGIRRLESLTYGDTSAGNSLPARVRAGTLLPNGGLTSGNRFPMPGQLPPNLGSASSRARLIPMILFQGELREGPNANAVVMFPTIWELDNDQSPMLNAWHTRAPASIRLFAPTSRSLISRRVGSPIKTRVEVLRETVDRNDFDRPVGMEGDSFSPFRAGTATFSPWRFFLIFSSAQAAANSTLNSSTGLRGVVDIPYADGPNYGPGSYTIFLQVERLP